MATSALRLFKIDPKCWFNTTTAASATALLVSHPHHSQHCRTIHSNRASICRIHLKPNQYPREYLVTIVEKDGSTIQNVRYPVPRMLIKLPLLLSDCDKQQTQREWLKRRKPTEVIVVKKDDTDVKYDPKRYLAQHFMNTGGKGGGGASGTAAAAAKKQQTPSKNKKIVEKK